MQFIDYEASTHTATERINKILGDLETLLRQDKYVLSS